LLRGLYPSVVNTQKDEKQIVEQGMNLSRS
jgi:hypothetical protein